MTNPQSLVFRGGTVLTMDKTHTIVEGADVLVVGDSDRRRSGWVWTYPAGTVEIDAARRHGLPGFIDTHRHMWQTAMRGYGADWTLTQYFVWYYLEHGHLLPARGRPRRQPAGRLESLESGVTTVVDWSHGLQPVDHAQAAVDALQRCPAGTSWRTATSRPARGVVGRSGRPRVPGAVPGRRRFLTACSWRSTSPATRRSRRRRRSRWPASWACRSPPTPGCGVRPATTASGRCTTAVSCHPETVYVHAASLSTDSYHRIAATGGSISVSAESRTSAGQGYPPTWQVRGTASRCPCPWIPASGGAATCSPQCGHAGRRPLPRALRGASEG